MTDLMSGQVPDETIMSLLTAWREKGETREELLGAAQILREKAVRIEGFSAPENAVDNCGTGGDGSGTFNVSTTAAFVVAGADVPVAKHGNRSVSSKSGSADVLEKLGIRLDFSPAQVADCLTQTGFAFFFAPVFHPAMKCVAAARKKMGTKTIFNLLGPLINPVRVSRQIIGVYDPAKMVMMAEVLKSLGSTHVWLVHGADGLDEVTLSAKTHVVRLHDGKIDEFDIDPVRLGLNYISLEAMKGGDVAVNTIMTEGILSGLECPQRDMVLLNAAAALVVAGRARELEEGLTIAGHSIDRGLAKGVLSKVIAYSQASKVAL